MQLFHSREIIIQLTRLKPAPVSRRHWNVRMDAALTLELRRSFYIGLEHIEMFEISNICEEKLFAKTRL